jgi:serine/threonine-protein kinase
MSPEQAQGKPLTSSSDIYSLAVILYEVLTGKLPFEAKSAMDYIQLHVTGKPVPLNQRVVGRVFPQLLEDIVGRALAKKPEERFESAAAFADALQAVLRGAVTLGPQVTPGSAPHPAPQAPPPSSAAAWAAAPQPRPQPPPAVAGHATAATVPMAVTPLVMDRRPPASAPRPLAGVAASPKTNVPLLVAVAVAFLLIGIGLALVLVKYVMH